MIDVVLVDEVDAVLRIGEVYVCRFERFSAGQRLEGGAELGFHGGAVEVAGDADDDVVGNDGAGVPCLEVVDGDGADGGVLGLAGVGVVGAIGELDGFAGGDAAGVVVAAGDAGLDLLPGELKLFFVEHWMKEEIHRVGEDGVEVLFEARPVDGGGG